MFVTLNPKFGFGLNGSDSKFGDDSDNKRPLHTHPHFAMPPGRPKLNLTDAERKERKRIQGRARQHKHYHR
jgi:hypothetical protein